MQIVSWRLTSAAGIFISVSYNLTKMKQLILILVVTVSIVGCKSADVQVGSDFTTKNDSINLYAFIGQRISVTEFDPNENNTRIEIDSVNGDTIRHLNLVMDLGFKARYKVLKNVFNDLGTDTVDFIAYDHYGRPGFENHENVILYISQDEEGNYYHQKYQFDPVKRTKNGVWKGLKGKSIKQLFEDKKIGVFKARGLFE